MLTEGERMEFDAAIPIWMQVATCIKTDMVTKKLLPGDKLPGGRELALRYTINPNTAARVYQELERQGLVETRRGMGTYVTDSPEKIAALRADMARTAVRDYLDKMRALGYGRAEALRIIEEEAEEC